jgi:Hemerythrin HHE cation binding domain
MGKEDSMGYKLDMTMMLAIHNAFRRDLEQIGRVAEGRGDSRLQTALGWELFKKFLLVHHQSEDDALWPTLRARVAEQPARVALVDALEAEHAAIDPLLVAVDAALTDPAGANRQVGDLVDELATALNAHLAHEESDGLALVDAALTAEEWQHFSLVHADRARADAPMYMPWLLNGASPQTLGTVLSKFPPPLLNAFRQEWGPNYAALPIWDSPR